MEKLNKKVKRSWWILLFGYIIFAICSRGYLNLMMDSSGVNYLHLGLFLLMHVGVIVMIYGAYYYGKSKQELS